ncbi:hypothetical protein EDD21DRAFT_424991, partial [Dissophora ornata]
AYQFQNLHQKRKVSDENNNSENPDILDTELNNSAIDHVMSTNRGTTRSEQKAQQTQRQAEHRALLRQPTPSAANGQAPPVYLDESFPIITVPVKTNAGITIHSEKSMQQAKDTDVDDPVDELTRRIIDLSTVELSDENSFLDNQFIKQNYAVYNPQRINDNRITMPVMILGESVEALIDTGASHSFISRNLVQQHNIKVNKI